VEYSASEWLERFSAVLGIEAPSEEEVNELLDLAGIAARASERTAAPVSCWLVARAGVTPAEARAKASELAATLAE
jgi:hypothetical protein